jgi:hypothetical protein
MPPATADLYIRALLVEMARTERYSLTLCAAQVPLVSAAAPAEGPPPFAAIRAALKALAGLDPAPAATPQHARFNIGLEGEHATDRYDVGLVFDDAAPDPTIIVTLVFDHSEPGGTADYE